MWREKDVEKDVLISELNHLTTVKPPANEYHVKRLIEKIKETSRIQLSDIIKNLSMAGYDGETILKFMIRTGLVESKDEIAALREATRRVIQQIRRYKRKEG